MRVHDEGQGLTQTVAVGAQHLLENTAPLRHRALLVTSLFASDDEHRDRMRTVTAQRARTREGGTHSTLRDAHAVGEPSFLHACLGLLTILAPGKFTHRATARQTQAVRPRRRADEGHHVII